MSEISRQLLICLVSAHLIGDFLLQTKKDAFNKHKITIVLKHAGIVTAASYLICGAWTLLEIPLILVITHSTFDFLKARFANHSLKALIADQAAHLIVIIFIVSIITRRHEVFDLQWVDAFGKNFLQLLILISGAVTITKAGRIIIGMATSPLLARLETVVDHPVLSTGNPTQTVLEESENRGKLIGQLERALIFLFVLLNNPVGIGFLLTAKAILRFYEIKNRRQRIKTDYTIIGTLMSFIFGILIAYATKYCLDWV